MNTRDEIIEAMARAFYVCAYADMVERAWEDGEGDDLPYASMGADWMDIAPETSETAREAARALAASIAALNGTGLAALFERAVAKCEDDGDESVGYGRRCRRADRHTPHEFGHYLVMVSIGHGVSWSDDHVDHEIRVPNTDFHLFPDDLEGDAESIDTRFC